MAIGLYRQFLDMAELLVPVLSSVTMGFQSMKTSIVGSSLRQGLGFLDKYSGKFLSGFYGVSDEESGDKKYDAFISFTYADSKFVSDLMVPILEENFKLCLHYRDWEVGVGIPTQIYNSINESKFTIVVMSPSFLNSEWCVYELKMALRELRKSRLLTILYEDIDGCKEDLDEEIKYLLDKIHFIKWKNTPQFWEDFCKIVSSG